MALIPPFFLNCVVSIGIAQAHERTTWIGTGFMVGRPTGKDGTEKRFHTFLITNKHVLAGKRDIVLRYNTLDNARVIDYPVMLEQEDGLVWVGHPSADVDIAAIFINPGILEQDGATLGFFALDDHVMSVEDMRNDGVSEGDGVFVLGFPMGIVAPQGKHVIARSGAIARIRDVLDGHQSSFLIDANIFPGNSGGPVVIRPEMTAIEGTKPIRKAALVGIVKSYVPYRDIAISQQTGNPRVIFEENSGLALVETVDDLKLTVEECYQQKVASQGQV